MELNGNSDANPRNEDSLGEITSTEESLAVEITDQLEGKRGRKSIVETNRRKALVQELILKGVKPLEIANLGVANYKTILKDIKEIQSSWLELDPEWFHRARLARIKSEQMYESQLKRLFAYLENERFIV